MKRLRAEFAARRVTCVWAQLKCGDGTGITLALTPRYGRAASGKRVVDPGPQNSGENLSFLAVLSLNGLSAPMSVEGAVDTAVFLAYVERVLSPTLRPGEIVGMDNLAVHKVAAIAQLITARGARIESLPPYSPDLNPMEKGWAQLNTVLRQAKARTREALEEGLSHALTTLRTADARAWFTQCGYPGH